MRSSMPILPCLARLLVLLAIPAIAVAIVLALVGTGNHSSRSAMQINRLPAEIGYVIRGGMVLAAVRG
jgi:hypothetical protein